ncbi:hypothetical protein [Enterococcus faecalis]|uniref:hypothetical protein n=1 Tax=Enterococcus faecalis TaxID=1351 RepID=UPI001E559308|nr:hypothetical protein [Enterococcus faecalis]MCD4978466.1 hypothetical protein [Enterococcus faecalis]
MSVAVPMNFEGVYNRFVEEDDSVEFCYKEVSSGEIMSERLYLEWMYDKFCGRFENLSEDEDQKEQIFFHSFIQFLWSDEQFVACDQYGEEV